MGKESEQLVAIPLTGTKWMVKKLELLVVGEWIELGRKLRGASDEEILSFISSLERYFEKKLEDEALLSADYREYVSGYAETILEAARAELRKRNLKRFG